jgi:hypothetical protein
VTYPYIHENVWQVMLPSIFFCHVAPVYLPPGHLLAKGVLEGSRNLENLCGERRGCKILSLLSGVCMYKHL